MHDTGLDGAGQLAIRAVRDAGRVLREVWCVARAEWSHLEGQPTVKRGGLDLFRMSAIVGAVALRAMRGRVNQVPALLDDGGVGAGLHLRQLRIGELQPANR